MDKKVDAKDMERVKALKNWSPKLKESSVSPKVLDQVLAAVDSVFGEVIANQDKAIDAAYNWLDGHPEAVDLEGMSVNEVVARVMESERFKGRMRKVLSDVVATISSQA